MNFLSIMLIILSAPALFVPVFSGYVLGFFMIILAVLSWQSDQPQKACESSSEFTNSLLPISRGCIVFWSCLAFSSLVPFATPVVFDGKALVSSLGNYFVKYVLLWFVYLSFWWRVGSSERNWKIFSISYAACSFINASYCLIQRQTGVDWAHGFGHFLGENRFAYGVYRVSGFMGHPLTFGYCQVLALVASFYLAINAIHREEKIAWWLSSASAFFVLLISGSRGPQLVAIFGLVLMVPFSLWKKRFRVIVLALAALLIMGIWFGFFNRFSELFSRGVGGDMRSIHWAVHWQIFKDNFWFGMGPGALKPAISAYYFALQADDNIKLAHNTFLQCAADFGFVGFVGMCVWLLSWARIKFRTSEPKRAILVVLVVTVLAGFTQNNLQDSGFVLGLTTWTMIISSYEVSRRDKFARTTKNSNHLSREGGTSA